MFEPPGETVEMYANMELSGDQAPNAALVLIAKSITGPISTKGVVVILSRLTRNTRSMPLSFLRNATLPLGAGGVVTVGVEREADAVVVSVTDQGSGLQVDDPDLLFQPFYSTKGRGSGVGLAMVQRIVTDHGGTVRLESNEPRGVRAVVRVPGGQP